MHIRSLRRCRFSTPSFFRGSRSPLANVLDKLPKRLQPKAKRALYEIMNAATRADAQTAMTTFTADYQASTRRRWRPSSAIRRNCSPSSTFRRSTGSTTGSLYCQQWRAPSVEFASSVSRSLDTSSADQKQIISGTEAAVPPKDIDQAAQRKQLFEADPRRHTFIPPED